MATVRVIRSIGLGDTATSADTSTVNEPTAAANGNDIFVTGNWFASMSRNSGASWSHISPFTALPSAAGGFCCDQIVLFDSSRGIWIWILQYIETGGNNVFRVAISRAASFGSWYWWDFNPRGLNAAWTDMWFDYPDAALSSNHLYVTFNAFNAAGSWLRAFVFKFPLDGLASGGSLGYQWWSTTTNGSLRLTQGATSTMFFGSHNGRNPLRVFSWPDGPGGISSFDVTTSAWSAGPYNAPAPGGINWLGRIDSRITGAWIRGNRAGFLWTASSSAGRPVPYVKAAEVDTSTRTLIGQPDIWNNTVMFAYPAASTNSAGVVGVSPFYASSTIHPSLVVAINDAGVWRLAVGRSGTHTSPDRRWGDYLTCYRFRPNQAEWVASGYTLQGGTDRRNVEPQYVHFGVA
ncbi:MAG: hypothetical protein M3198_20240 [Actinomycetota bacterium]|nr:hypothetical protein [Actinomycetota bacterium]